MNKKQPFTVVAAAFCCCLCSCTAHDFTIASYNIRSFRKMDKTRDVSGTISAIGSLNSDVCALQEVRLTDGETPSALELAGQQLDMSHFFAKTLRRPDFDYGIGALSKFKAEEIASPALPTAPTEEPRRALILKIHCSGGPFYLVNTHLTNGAHAVQTRQKQLNFILDYLESRQLYPAILLGDLNSVYGKPDIDMLKEKWQMIGDNTPTYPADSPRWKLDHIAFYPRDAFEVISWETVNEPSASDHRPFKARLRLKQR